MDEQRLVGVLYEVASNYAHIMNVALDVPASVSDAFGLRGHIPVVGTADRVELIATLVPVGSGRRRPFVSGAIREAIGKGASDAVEIRIRLDRRDRTPETPRDLEEALAEGGATASWRRAPSRHKKLLAWLADTKRDQTRANRVDRIVQSAREEGTRRLGQPDPGRCCPGDLVS